MADVKWVKITTDMFDNRKIKHLRRLPEGDSIVLIWVMLLTMAGRCNAGGMIFLTENIPYSPKMLADELDFEENTVILALEALERLQMVVKDGGCLMITGWEEYQNIEGLEKIRERERLKKAKQREKKKLLSSPDGCVPGTVPGTSPQCPATDIELEEEQEGDKKDIGGNSSELPEEKPTRKRFIPPTVEEVQAYCTERGNSVDPGAFVDFYESKGWMIGKNKMKDWKRAVHTWERTEGRGTKKNADGRNERNPAENPAESAGGVGTWL